MYWTDRQTDRQTELIVHHISLLLESNPDWVILKTDLKNAFNSVSRSHLLPEVAKAFPGIYQHVHQMYAGFSPLVFNDGKIAHILRSEKGIHQGDPLGPMLFSVALHPFLLDLQKNHSSTRVLAYLDDMFFIGPMEDVLLCLNDAESSLKRNWSQRSNRKMRASVQWSPRPSPSR